MKKSLVLSLLAAAVSAATARADVVYDNVTTNGVTGYTSGTTIGQSFVTGGVSLTLNAFVFSQTDSSSAYAFTTGETVTLYGNNPATNSPAALALASFNLSKNSGTTTEADPSAATALTANTRYWLVLGAPTSTGTVYWSFYGPSGYTANYADGVMLPDMNTAFKTAGGNTTFFSFSQGPQSSYLAADVLLVPEPSTWALLASGGVGALFLVRRARASQVV